MVKGKCLYSLCLNKWNSSFFLVFMIPEFILWISFPNSHLTFYIRQIFVFNYYIFSYFQMYVINFIHNWDLWETIYYRIIITRNMQIFDLGHRKKLKQYISLKFIKIMTLYVRFDEENESYQESNVT